MAPPTTSQRVRKKADAYAFLMENLGMNSHKNPPQ